MRIVKWLIGMILFMGLGVGMFNYYPYIFSKKVVGVVMDVQKVELTNTILTRSAADIPFMHAFAVAIKDNSGEIFTASTEDRQWAVVKAGQCVVAEFFPYPPWDLKKGGTYFGARLLKLSDCTAEKKAP